MDINQIVNDAHEDDVKLALSYLLENFITPEFGSSIKNDNEYIVLNSLTKIHALNPNPEVYELVSKLNVSRSKARLLIHQQKQNKSAEPEPKTTEYALIKTPFIQKNSDFFVDAGLDLNEAKAAKLFESSNKESA